ncbi:MAG: Rpn family recombination-promoting nuclease/putative transposase, partial [Acidobacteria bacterium]|nr:Rpn family recombination-promoting nuclease/putative transposase [Acidobacteriota bacterium]
MKFDTTLKELLLSNPTRLVEQLSGEKVEAWLNVEQPSVKMRRIDLVARLKSGRILHLEIQLEDDPEMPWRMLEYYAYLRRTYGQEPWQIVLYIGKKKPRRKAYIREQRLRFSYNVIYLRELDGRPLLDSDSIADNLLAILCDIDDVITASRRIIEKLLALPEKQAIDEALKLIILSKLRGAEKIVTEEVNKRMKITREYLIDIPLIGDLMLSGEEQAETRGEKKGEKKEAQKMLTKMLEARYGALPAWAKKQLAAADLRKLEHWSLQLLT